jgi:myosin heavy subunit
MSLSFDPDSWVWITDPDECSLPAKVIDGFRPGESGRVQTEDGEILELEGKETEDVIPCDEEVLSSEVANLIKLNDLREEAILHNLRIRYIEDKIYTYVSSILISVNPFKLLPLYTPEVLDSYRQSSSSLPPHVFAIASNAYERMLGEGENQSIIISGESGAGKSEATKLILQFLAEVSSRSGSAHHQERKENSDEQGGDSEEEHSLEQQVLGSNPIMEAFGNAKTLRNDNSSRFGKLITVRFDKGGSIRGGKIINYLLEKSRVVTQTDGERNYHIFYQLLAAGEADDALSRALTLDSPEMFRFTNQSRTVHLDGVSDEKEFEDMRAAMDTLNFSPQEQLDIFKVVSGVLQFGNVTFSPNPSDEDACVINNTEQVNKGAFQWGLMEAEIAQALTSKNIGTRSIIMVSYSDVQARDTRDAMVKRVYANLFQWIIDKINQVLSRGIDFTDDANSQFIGVLDIFGFESFETNSFEQLCINYCNEKLQFHFNEHIFRLEQEMYAEEGVIVPATDFKDNQPTLDLIEMKVSGIFAMIDEEINVPRGSDEGFLSKLKQGQKDHPNFIAPRPKDCKDHMDCFGVAHYAGPVYYNVANFLEKNKDALHPDLVSLMRNSEFAFLASLFPEDPEEEGDASGGGNRASSRGRRGAKKSKMTLGGQFKEQLNQLMDTLNSTFPHFVRCMKPNDSRAGNLFVAPRILDQLRYAGLLEVCRIRKLGYPVRRDFEDFYKRYRVICPGTADVDALLGGLLEAQVLVEGEFAKGTSRVFMRIPQSNALDMARDEAFLKETLRLQKMIRGWLGKVRFRRFLKTIKSVRSAVEAGNKKDLVYWLDMSAELPWGGSHIPIVKEGRSLLARIEEEERLTKLIQDAIQSRDLSSLRSVVATSEGMKPPFNSGDVEEARSLIARIEEEIALKAKLTQAVNRRDRAELEQLLAEAEAMELGDCGEVRQAVTLRNRLEEEDNAMEDLQKAMEDKSLSHISSYLSKCQELGLDNELVAEARKLQHHLQAQNKAKEALRQAVEDNSIGSLQKALEKAASLEIPATSPEVVDATALLEKLQNEKEGREQLKDAVGSRSLEALEAALSHAQDLSLSEEDMAEATELRDLILVEMNCLEQLRSAVESNDMRQISNALKEAGRLGLTGEEVEAARAAAQKMGEEAELRTKLVDVASSATSLEEFDAVLEKAAKMGLSEDEEVQTAKEARQKLEEDLSIVGQLDEAVANSDVTAIADLLTLLQDREVLGKFSSAVQAAKEKQKELNAQAFALENLRHAIEKGEAHGLEHALAEARENSVDEFVIAEGESALNTCRERDEVASQLSVAISENDKSTIRELLPRAKELDVPLETIQEAQVIVEREEMMQKTKDDLVTACDEKNLSKLNEAMEMAIQLGISGDEMERAKVVRDELGVVEEGRSVLTAAVRSLSMLAENKGGISESDIEPFSAALEEAASKGLPEDDVTFVNARSLHERMTKQVEIQANLQTAIEADEKNELKKVLKLAANAGLNHLDLYQSARACLREIELSESKKEQEDKEGEDEGDMLFSDDELAQLERERQEARSEAMDDRFELRYFGGLRSTDDFAKGIILNKKKLKESMLVHSSSQIPKSLTDLSRDLNKLALQINKDMLGYMGEKAMQFPATLAQDILQKGIETMQIRDEIYAQLIKQLTDNGRSESLAKGWQLMCMCVSCFPPTSEFESFLLHFILIKENSPGAVSNYAHYCLRTLEGVLSTGSASGFVPSVDEIAAYKERPPILATLYLVDGTPFAEDIPVTPDFDVAKVLEMCYPWLELSSKYVDSLGIFVVDEGPMQLYESMEGQELWDSVPITPRPLQNSEFMGDIVVQRSRQKRNFRFVLKKKVFLNSEVFVQPEDVM